MGIYRDLYDKLKDELNQKDKKIEELKKIITKQKEDSIYKKIRAFKSCCTFTDLKKIRASVRRQINEDKNKDSLAAIKRIANNKEFLFVYDIIINFKSYFDEVERIDSHLRKNGESII